MPDGRHQAPRGRSRGANGISGGAVANEQKLRDLGQAVERRNGNHSPVKRRGKRRRKGRTVGIVAGVLVVVLVAGLGGLYLHFKGLFDAAKTLGPVKVFPVISGKPFNILEIGSDSRAGLTGKYQGLAGNAVSGQRSDVIKIMHVDPTNLTITVISIPRDTMVSLLANQNLFTDYNRINVNYQDGPGLLVRTIEANFGIPINHVVQVSFGGIINAATTIGGVYLNFPDRARDAYSGLRINHTGCQLVNNFQALAVVRSRHYEYLYHGYWYSDFSSDYGRIARQDAFIKALINRTKSEYNPFTINTLLEKLPAGIALDQSWSFNDTLGLAYRFRNFQSQNMKTFILPTASVGYVAPYGDVLVVDQPAAQKLLVSVFGNELTTPTNPPPNASMHPNPPPFEPIPTSTTTTVPKHHSQSHHSGSTTTTTIPTGPYLNYNPIPCSPS